VPRARTEPPVALALGSNLEPRHEHLAGAARAIARDIGEVLDTSAIYETDPVGPTGQGPYLNQVVLLRSGHSPGEILRRSLEIEGRRGRRRDVRWGPRTLDIDLLLYGSETRDDAALKLPHPRLHERPFVLVPLGDVLPRWVHPRLGQTVLEMLAASGRSGVRIWGGAAAKRGG